MRRPINKEENKIYKEGEDAWKNYLEQEKYLHPKKEKDIYIKTQKVAVKLHSPEAQAELAGFWATMSEWQKTELPLPNESIPVVQGTPEHWISLPFNIEKAEAILNRPILVTHCRVAKAENLQPYLDRFSNYKYYNDSIEVTHDFFKEVLAKLLGLNVKQQKKLEKVLEEADEFDHDTILSKFKSKLEEENKDDFPILSKLKMPDIYNENMLGTICLVLLYLRHLLNEIGLDICDDFKEVTKKKGTTLKELRKKHSSVYLHEQMRDPTKLRQVKLSPAPKGEHLYEDSIAQLADVTKRHPYSSLFSSVDFKKGGLNLNLKYIPVFQLTDYFCDQLKIQTKKESYELVGHLLGLLSNPPEDIRSDEVLEWYKQYPKYIAKQNKKA